MSDHISASHGLGPFVRDDAKVRAWTSGVLMMLAAASALQVGKFNPIGTGLDASWAAVLGEAASRGYVFGRDIAFARGPLSAFYTRYFDPMLWPFILLADVLVVAALAWSSGRLATNWLMVLLLPFAMFAASIPDAALMALPAYAALSVLLRPGASYAFIVLTAVATALAILAKFTPAVIALVSFIAIDIEFVRERRLPVAVVVFAASVVGWFALFEGAITSFVDFIRYTLEIVAGYAAAMSINGNPIDLGEFVVVATTLGAIVVARTRRHAVSGSFFKPLSVMLVLGVLCFSGFKGGFIRHDGHRVIGWGVVALAAAAYAGFEERRAARWLVIVLCLISAAIAPYYAAPGVLPALQFHARTLGDQLTGLAQLALDPQAWFQQQRTAMESGRSKVRAAWPLPPIQGSIDSLPAVQSSLIAAGLDYRPRFTIQDYADYTPALIAKNHASWFGNQAPDHILFALAAVDDRVRSPDDILFGLAPIDGRYPPLNEGPLWPDLLRFYEPTRRLPPYAALLSHRTQPLPNLLGPPTSRIVRIGERLNLDRHATFLALDIRYSWLGRVLSLLFKPPEVMLRLVNEAGQQNVYRIIPGIAVAGFLVSPEVLDTNAFIALALGEQEAFGPSSWPTSATVEISKTGSWAYSHNVTATLRTVDLSILRSARKTTLETLPK